MVRPTLLKELMFSRIVATNQPFTSRLKRPPMNRSVQCFPWWISPPNLGIPGIQQLTIRGDPLTASFDGSSCWSRSTRQKPFRTSENRRDGTHGAVKSYALRFAACVSLLRWELPEMQDPPKSQKTNPTKGSEGTIFGVTDAETSCMS